MILVLNNTQIKTLMLVILLQMLISKLKIKHIYAAGDCIGQLQLAHVGSKEAIVAVEHMFDCSPIPINYDLIPKCVYTNPEIFNW